MENRNKVIEVIKEILKRSKDTHNIYTPLELCDEMIGKLPELNSNMKILVMFNLEFLWVIREKLGKENMKNVWFMTPCEYKGKRANAMGVVENQVIIYEYNNKLDKDLLKKLNDARKTMQSMGVSTKEVDEKIELVKGNKIKGIENMKFDVVVGNPPYLQNLYIDFLNLSYDISNKYVIMLHPGTIYFNEKDNRRLKKEILFKNKSKNNIKEIDLFSVAKYFNIALWAPICISFIDKQKNDNSLIVNDKIKNLTFQYDNIENLNKFGNIKEYFSIKEKILNFKDNLQNHVNYIYGKRQNKFNYYINIAQLRGHSYTNISKLVDDDFYTFIPKNQEVECEINKKLYFGFKTEIEARYFLNYLKTNFSRFCLSLLKINMNINRGELKSVPWLDFTQEWTDEKLYEYFNLTQEEINFIETNIPKYY